MGEYVLVVCTEIYQQRASMNAKPGEGLGALWESHLIFQFLYDAGTENPKFIPVLPPGGQLAHIPPVLRGVQRYWPFSDEGYLNLYRRLTGQPAIEAPALGKLVVMGPVTAPPATMAASGSTIQTVTSRLALLGTQEATAYVPVVESHWDGTKALMVFQPDDAGDGALLDGLRDRHRDIALAYKGNAAICRAAEVQQRSKDGVDRWHISFELNKTEFSSWMEYQAEGLTPDEAAILRTRRLLLNENLPDPNNRDMSKMMRETMIEGQADVKIHQSPFPDLFRQFGDKPDLFIEIAWITAMLNLKLSATVEHVGRFELKLEGRILHVEFEGKRRKYYTNVPAPEVKVSGTCTL